MHTINKKHLNISLLAALTLAPHCSNANNINININNNNNQSQTQTQQQQQENNLTAKQDTNANSSSSKDRVLIEEMRINNKDSSVAFNFRVGAGLYFNHISMGANSDIDNLMKGLIDFDNSGEDLNANNLSRYVTFDDIVNSGKLQLTSIGEESRLLDNVKVDSYLKRMAATQNGFSSQVDAERSSDNLAYLSDVAKIDNIMSDLSLKYNEYLSVSEGKYVETDGNIALRSISFSQFTLFEVFNKNIRVDEADALSDLDFDKMLNVTQEIDASKDNVSLHAIVSPTLIEGVTYSSETGFTYATNDSGYDVEAFSGQSTDDPEIVRLNYSTNAATKSGGGSSVVKYIGNEIAGSGEEASGVAVVESAYGEYRAEDGNLKYYYTSNGQYLFASSNNSGELELGSEVDINNIVNSSLVDNGKNLYYAIDKNGEAFFAVKNGNTVNKVTSNVGEGGESIDSEFYKQLSYDSSGVLTAQKDDSGSVLLFAPLNTDTSVTVSGDSGFSMNILQTNKPNGFSESSDVYDDIRNNSGMTDLISTLYNTKSVSQADLKTATKEYLKNLNVNNIAQNELVGAYQMGSDSAVNIDLLTGINVNFLSFTNSDAMNGIAFIDNDAGEAPTAAQKDQAILEMEKFLSTYNGGDADKGYVSQYIAYEELGDPDGLNFDINPDEKIEFGLRAEDDGSVFVEVIKGITLTTLEDYEKMADNINNREFGFDVIMKTADGSKFNSFQQPSYIVNPDIGQGNSYYSLVAREDKDTGEIGMQVYFHDIGMGGINANSEPFNNNIYEDGAKLSGIDSAVYTLTSESIGVPNIKDIDVVFTESKNNIIDGFKGNVQPNIEFVDATTFMNYLDAMTSDEIVYNYYQSQETDGNIEIEANKIYSMIDTLVYDDVFSSLQEYNQDARGHAELNIDNESLDDFEGEALINISNMRAAGIDVNESGIMSEQESELYGNIAQINLNLASDSDAIKNLDQGDFMVSYAAMHYGNAESHLAIHEETAQAMIDFQNIDYKANFDASIGLSKYFGSEGNGYAGWRIGTSVRIGNPAEEDGLMFAGATSDFTTHLGYSGKLKNGGIINTYMIAGFSALYNSGLTMASFSDISTEMLFGLELGAGIMAIFSGKAEMGVYADFTVPIYFGDMLSNLTAPGLEAGGLVDAGHNMIAPKLSVGLQFGC